MPLLLTKNKIIVILRRRNLDKNLRNTILCKMMKLLCPTLLFALVLAGISTSTNSSTSKRAQCIKSSCLDFTTKNATFEKYKCDDKSHIIVSFGNLDIYFSKNYEKTFPSQYKIGFKNISYNPLRPRPPPKLF